MSIGVKLLLSLLLAVNLITFVLFGIDKLKAKKSSWRIPEFTLLCWAFFGGSAGAALGMKTFRHKTLHKKFSILVPLFLLMHLAAASYIIYKFGLMH